MNHSESPAEGFPSPVSAEIRPPLAYRVLCPSPHPDPGARWAVRRPPVKLMIQIPCLNETGTLEGTFADLPRHCEGIDEIEVVVIDDGSSDGTAELAERLGVHHIIRFPRNRGLAVGFMAGIDACLRLGADIIVNTDADNQYRGADIPRIVAPIIEGRADLVIGDRQTDTIEHYSFIKKVFQRWGSRIIRKLSASDVADSPSGFRAISRSAALQLFVHNRFTYTLETVIQAGHRGIALANVPIVTNPKTREPRLFKSIPDYLRRAGPVMFRAYAMYRPVQLFSHGARALLLFGIVVGVRFLYHYFRHPDYSGFIQSLVVGTGAVVLAFIMLIAAMLAELLAGNRRLLEETLMRVRRLESRAGSELRPSAVEGVRSTEVPSWRPLRYSGHAESSSAKKVEHG